MNLQDNGSTPTAAGTIGGTCMVIFLQITTGALLQTIVLAALGAVVSFGTSLLCKKLVNNISKKNKGKKTTT
ncbi:hypothetical protein [Ferruginibacter sp. SUN106]|uniref:hypothetical protein n=1 Tax=Ferruginibacter sp. SUN106 TaxID=2978348 RepID=UPI003D362C08